MFFAVIRGSWFSIMASLLTWLGFPCVMTHVKVPELHIIVLIVLYYVDALHNIFLLRNQSNILDKWRQVTHLFYGRVYVFVPWSMACSLPVVVKNILSWCLQQKPISTVGSSMPSRLDAPHDAACTHHGSHSNSDRFIANILILLSSKLIMSLKNVYLIKGRQNVTNLKRYSRP